MKAYEIVKPAGIDGLALNANRADPAPGHDQIVIRVRATSLNYRDQGVAQGTYRHPRFPVIPLSDGAGEVVAVGPEVTQFKVGDRAAGTFFQTWMGGRMPADAAIHSLGGYIDGMLAEYVALPQCGAIGFPDHLDFDEAATLPCAALTAWNALVASGNIKAGESVALLGTGGVSCFGIQFAKLHGARVFVTSSSDEKLGQAKALGADVLVNYKATPDWDKEIIRETGGAGVDHILEVGGPNTLERSLNAVRVGGMIHVIGARAGAGNTNPRSISQKGVTLRGINVGSHEMFEGMNRAVANAKLKPAIDKVFPFAEAKQAYVYQLAGSFGKVVIQVG